MAHHGAWEGVKDSHRSDGQAKSDIPGRTSESSAYLSYLRNETLRRRLPLRSHRLTSQARLTRTARRRQKNQPPETVGQQILTRMKKIIVNWTLRRKPDSRIATALESVSRHHGRRITVKELARSVQLSPSRFSHLFALAAGMPPARFLKRQRSGPPLI